MKQKLVSEERYESNPMSYEEDFTERVEDDQDDSNHMQK